MLCALCADCSEAVRQAGRNQGSINLVSLWCTREVLTEMPERQALAIVGCGLVLMALALIRPSSGMRLVVFALLLAAAALAGISWASNIW